MKELAPGYPVVVEEATESHWIATARDLVLVFGYAGSSGDARHIETTARVIRRVNRDCKERARLLFVLPEGGTAPPSPAVREAIVEAARGGQDRVARAALIIPRAGFGAAVQRAVVGGIAMLARWTVPNCITSDLAEGVAYVVGPDQALVAPLFQLCTQRRRAESGHAG